MVRIEGVVLPNNKRIEYALPYIFGLGLASSRVILTGLKISFDTRVKDLSNEHVAAIQKVVSEHYKVEGELRKGILMNVRRLQEIKSYRGDRHKKGLPLRGQRTKTNARTRKGPRGEAIKLKKKIAK
jgi:small subunit ribosomal protein S13